MIQLVKKPSGGTRERAKHMTAAISRVYRNSSHNIQQNIKKAIQQFHRAVRGLHTFYRVYFQYDLLRFKVS